MKHFSKLSMGIVGVAFLSTIIILNLFDSYVAKASSPIGEQKTLVVMINFSDTSTPALTKATVDDIMFNQVDAFYRENSYNQTFITGDSFGWLDLPYTKTCDRNTMLSYALEAVAPLTDITQYSHIFVTGPFEGCGFAAWSSFGTHVLNTPDGVANTSTSWINSITFGANTMMHEFGHGLGLDHANFYNCGTESLPATPCSSVEYGDPYDIMASGINHPHLNAGNKDFLGWFNSNTISTVAENGRYNIEPIETNTGGLKAIRIPRGNNDYLYVEYRQPIGFDSGIGTNSDVFEGALVHIGQFKTNLIDATPPTSSSNPALHPGQTLIDQKTGTSISVVEVNSTNIVVDVVVGRVDFSGPLVSIINPISNQEVSGLVSFQVEATDPSGVSGVEFYINNQLVNTDVESPYVFDWDSNTVANGSVNLNVIAYDQAGVALGQTNNSASSFVSFSVNNVDTVLPVISFNNFTNPANNPLNISVSATDNVGVAAVNFLLNGNQVLSDTTAPYVFNQTIYPGVYTLTAQARDNTGNFSEPLSVPLQVLAPTINIVNPTNGSLVTGMTNVVVNTSNPSTLVQLFVNSSMVGNLMTVNGVAQRNVDFSSYPAGSNIQIRATTTEAGYSAYNQIYVTKADVVPPVLSITSPVANSTVNGIVQITASATDISGISKVEFYVDSVLLSTDTSSPYVATWNTTSLVNNSNHTIQAKAYDNVGNISTQNISVTVADLVLPTVSITSPNGGSTVNGTVSINASATDNMGVSKVEFYVDSVLLSTDTSSPYVATWNTTSLIHNSSHSILVKAYDLVNNTASQSINVTVSDVTAPSLSITAPANNATVTRNKNTTISATSTDLSGISKVEFYVNNVLKCTDTTASYSCVWAVPSDRNTSYTIKAKSYDLAGNTTEKSIVVKSSR